MTLEDPAVPVKFAGTRKYHRVNILLSLYSTEVICSFPTTHPNEHCKTGYFIKFRKFITMQATFLILILLNFHLSVSVPDLEPFCTIQSMCDSFHASVSKVHHVSQTEMLCPKYFSLKPESHFGYCLNVSFDSNHYSDDRLLPFNGSHFIKSLVNSRTSITFIGDSISRQMYHTLNCMFESQNASIPEIERQIIQLNASMFLTRLPSPYYVPHIIFQASTPSPIVFHNISDLISEGWDDRIINSSYKNKIVVINSGAWWTPSYLHISDNTTVDVDGMIEIYRLHFAPGGHLDNILHRLTRHNVTVIWRDTAPAGSCNRRNKAHTAYNYHNRFHEMNVIARHLFTNRKRRYVLPHIYNVSLPLWNQHVGKYINNDDQLHWCTYVPNTAPWIWNTILYNFLFANGILHNSRKKGKEGRKEKGVVMMSMENKSHSTVPD
eukprot:gene2651-5204_t